MTVHRTRVCAGDAADIAAAWSRLVDDVLRFGLLGGPGACDAVARVGADVLDRAGAVDAGRAQFDAP